MAEEQAGNQQPQPQFAVQRIYTKDLSFESPMTPGVFREQWQPQVNVELNTRSDKVDEEGNFEVVLVITITAKVQEKTAFLCEVHQAGVFLLKGFAGDDLRRILGTAAPNILFPYARETIDNLVVKGGFPAVMLAPVNFDALFQQAQQQAKQQGGAAAADGEPATH
ncbi:MAG: protein-export chaperone SecB [Halioglobus sp.]|nr:protein-export chaperone SecB [Halioglobus sp.]